MTKGATTTDGEGGGLLGWSPAVQVSNCVLVGNSAGLGGGAFGGTLYNCTLKGNSATGHGGGVVGGYGGSVGTLHNCTLTGNSANSGGGSLWGTLNNCVLTGNSADSGGGAYDGTLNNCIVYYNSAPSGPNCYASALDHCCTTPLPGGTGNVDLEPRFVNTNGWSNLRLQSNSPCINAGNNACVSGNTDLDGLPRIVGGTVDIGAYEFQSPASAISYAWLQHYGLPTDGSADFTDSDGDHLNNWQEWRCRTDPTNAFSVLRLLPPQSSANHVTVSWSSVLGMRYFLERSTNLSATPRFTPLATNLIGQGSTTTFTDTNAPNAHPRVYRVGVPSP